MNLKKGDQVVLVINKSKSRLSYVGDVLSITTDPDYDENTGSTFYGLDNGFYAEHGLFGNLLLVMDMEKTLQIFKPL